METVVSKATNDARSIRHPQRAQPWAQASIDNKKEMALALTVAVHTGAAPGSVGLRGGILRKGVSTEWQ